MTLKDFAAFIKMPLICVVLEPGLLSACDIPRASNTSLMKVDRRDKQSVNYKYKRNCEESKLRCFADRNCREENCKNITYESYLEPRTGLTWIRIRGGTFLMGSASGRKNERPRHRVNLQTFWITKTEVTVEQYKRCVDAGACHVPVDKQGSVFAVGCTWNHAKRGAHPVNCVLWDWAVQYARWTDARLPSEAEWEFAARSRGKEILYPWGNTIPSHRHVVMSAKGQTKANVSCGHSTCPVCLMEKMGKTKQNLCDMAGNVAEYVADNYHANYVGAPRDGSAWLIGDTFSKVIRGGTTHCGISQFRVTRRNKASRKMFSPEIGFRVARNSIAVNK